MMPDVMPTPDPTVLTTAQLLREIASSRAIIEARMDGMDASRKSVEEHLSRVYDDISRQAGHLKELVSERIEGADRLVKERFAGVEKQFDERDIRAKAAEAATATGIVVGLQAQKEAAAKSEIAIAEKLNGLAALVDRSLLSQSEKVSDLSSRMDRSEAANLSLSVQRGENKQNIGVLLTACMAAAAFISVLVTLFLRHTP